MQINDIQQFAEGIGMTFFGALLLGFSVWMLPSERKLGAMQQCSGTVTASERETVTVTYQFQGKQYTAVLNEALRAKADTLPPAGCSAEILVYPQHPETPQSVSYTREYGRGQRSGHGYSTMPDKKRSVCMPVISIVMIILGIFQMITQL